MTRSERQALGIQKWINSGCKGTCLYCTGFGKTFTAITAVKRFLKVNSQAKVLVVVPTDYLYEQWFVQLAQFNLLNNVEVKVINTVVKYHWDVDLLIIDEIHVCGADTFFKVFKQVNYKLILGLTGTIDRLDGKQSLIKEKCPIVDEIKMADAIKAGWLAPYTEYKVLIEVDDIDDYKLAHQEFMKHFAKFNFDFKLAMACVAGEKLGVKVVKKPHQVQYDLAKQLCTLPHGHPDYNNTVKQIFADVKATTYAWNRAMKARKEFVMNHPKKVEVTQKILEARQNSKAITFSATIKNAESIGVGYVLHSGQTKKKRGMTRDEFEKLETGVLNSSKALDVGADIPGLNLAIILSNTSSSIQKTQRLGRVVRFAPDKHAEVFTLVIKGTNEEEWFRKSTGKMHYVEINEDQLEDVLNNQPIQEIKPKEENIFDFNL